MSNNTPVRWLHNNRAARRAYTNPERAARRRAIEAAGGFRQFKRARTATLRAERDAARVGFGLVV